MNLPGRIIVSESSLGSTTADTDSSRNGNGSAAASNGPEQNEKTSAEADASAVDRADAMVDAFAQKVGDATRVAGKGVLRFLARFREECSDIWAEAQNVRRGDKS
jgi:hypothetical protein